MKLRTAAETPEALVTTFNRATDAPEFLFGGGEAGALMRRLNWHDTPFGKPET